MRSPATSATTVRIMLKMVSMPATAWRSVPGSVGCRGLTSLIERQAVAGIETIFSMILTVVALVAGLLIAAAVIPERRMSLGDSYHE